MFYKYYTPGADPGFLKRGGRKLDTRPPPPPPNKKKRIKGNLNIQQLPHIHTYCSAHFGEVSWIVILHDYKGEFKRGVSPSSNQKKWDYWQAIYVIFQHLNRTVDIIQKEQLFTVKWFV